MSDATAVVGAPMTSALITIAHGRHDHLRAQLQHVATSDRLPDHHMVVAMDDPGIDAVVDGCSDHGGPAGGTRVLHLPAHLGGLPLAAARNLGARAALEAGAEVLVFLDVDCLPSAQLIRRYVDVAAAHRGDPHPRVWSGPVHYLSPLEGERTAYDAADLHASRPHPARPAPPEGQQLDEPRLQLFWSLSFALSRTDWERLGGFCEDYVGYGGEDTDLARVLEARGGRLTWVGGATAYHQHHPTSTPPVQHIVPIVRNANIFHDRWGDFPMLGWLHDFRDRGLVALDGDHWKVVPGSA